MLARKISASSSASAGRYGRNASLGFACAIIGHTLASSRPPHASSRPRSRSDRRAGTHAPQPIESTRRMGPRLREDDFGRGLPTKETASRSSRNLPGGAVLGVLQHHAHRGELVADAIGFGEVLGFAGGIAGAD